MPTLTGFSPVSIRGPAALPFIGVQANAVRLVADPIGRIMALQRQFGNLVAVADRSPALVLAVGPQYNHEVLSNTAAFDSDTGAYFKCPPGSGLDKTTRGLVFQAGEGHRRHRRLMMPAFHKAAVDGYAADIVATAAAALQTWPIGQTADIAVLTRDLVQHVAVRCLFGLDWKVGDAGLRLGRTAALAVELLTSPGTVALPFAIPGLPYARLLKVSDDMVEMLSGLIAQKRAQGSAVNDVLALMVRARDQDDSALTDDELIGEAMTLFVAGHDTQARTMAWALFLLGQHPKVLADVVDEVESVLRGGLPTLAHVPKFVLLDRVLKETMRVLAPVPLSFMKVAQTEVQLGGHTLPKGANVLVSPFLTHRDPDRFSEPTRFRPQRWESLQPTPHEYLPFGAGPRTCVGVAFANLAMRLILPMILQRHRFTLAYGARVSRLVRANILMPKYGLPMLVAPQDRHFVRRERVLGDIPEIVDLKEG